LSVLTGLLLIDGRPLGISALVALLLLVGTVSCVANYGYALNELYDRDEDRRGGRANVAESAGPRRLWIIIALSAAAAVEMATAAAGTLGLLLTVGELCVPLAYSVPPFRTKNRGWLGVLCDATAAHVYPAMLALAIVAHQQLRSPTQVLVLTAGLWALMTGLRGILSHQLQSEEHDLAAGLLTVVHRLGHRRLASWVTFGILPIEVVAFAFLLTQCDVTALFGLIAAIFLFYELLKFRLDAFPATVFTRRGGRYLPFVDEGAYKVWGPLALAIDAAGTDVKYLVLVPVYVALFRPRVAVEWAQIRSTSEMVRAQVGQLVARVFG
jgi:4-hydroxybenzoate polyprenyltransferase